MADLINKRTGAVSLKELSKYNGKTEFENMRMIILFLAQKAKFYNRPQKVIITFKGQEGQK